MATAPTRLLVGPSDHARPMSLDEFVHAEFEEGRLYELARGIVVLTDIPGISHGKIVLRTSDSSSRYDDTQPGVIPYRGGGSQCRLRLPGMQLDRHPDYAISLLTPPPGEQPWTAWVPQIVIEVVSRGAEDRDYREKREEYLRMGVLESWILDPARGRILVLSRAGDTWEEVPVPADAPYRTALLPGIEIRPRDLLG